MSNERNEGIHRLLTQKEIIFWDFDGVIKDSVTVKSCAFEQLFLSYGRELAARVRLHHESNGGLSRFDKIPLYLKWTGESPTPEKVQLFCDRFSVLVLQAVIDSNWVPGVREYLSTHYEEQYFVLVTATPQLEINHILAQLDISHCFREVHGAPNRKTLIIGSTLRRLNYPLDGALMVGDSDTDFDAAIANCVDFLLRRTSLNIALQKRHAGAFFDCLTP